MTLPQGDSAQVELARETRRENLHETTELTGVVADHIAAVNAFDIDAIVATFAPDAYVNDARREINGIDAIRRWVDKEIVGDHVTMEVREVIDHYGDTIVRARYDGTYDKTNLPDELVMSNYFSVRDDKIVSLAVIFNQPSPYAELGQSGSALGSGSRTGRSVPTGPRCRRVLRASCRGRTPAHRSPTRRSRPPRRTVRDWAAGDRCVRRRPCAGARRSRVESRRLHLTPEREVGQSGAYPQALGVVDAPLLKEGVRRWEEPALARFGHLAAVALGDLRAARHRASSRQSR